MIKNALFLALAVVVVAAFWLQQSRNDNKITQLQQNLQQMQKTGEDFYIKNQVKNRMTKGQAELRSCWLAYQKRAQAPKEGMIVLDWEINPAGQPSRPEVVSNQMEDQELEQCLASTIERWKFPAHDAMIPKYVSHQLRFSLQ